MAPVEQLARKSRHVIKHTLSQMKRWDALIVHGLCLRSSPSWFMSANRRELAGCVYVSVGRNCRDEVLEWLMKGLLFLRGGYGFFSISRFVWGYVSYNVRCILFIVLV